MERFPEGVMCVETKRIFALRLQQVANLTTQSPGLREAFSAIASLQQKVPAHAPEPAHESNVATVCHNDYEAHHLEEKHQQPATEVASPTLSSSIVAIEDDVHHHSVVHISSWDYQLDCITRHNTWTF